MSLPVGSSEKNQFFDSVIQMTLLMFLTFCFYRGIYIVLSK